MYRAMECVVRTCAYFGELDAGPDCDTLIELGTACVGGTVEASLERQRTAMALGAVRAAGIYLAVTSPEPHYLT